MNPDGEQSFHINECTHHPRIPDKFYMFPFVKKGATMKTSLAMDGLAVEDGWYDYLYVAFSAIWSHVCNKPELRNTFYISQVKEKFGTLRIYSYGGDEKINGIIRWVEKASARLCEFCGTPGAKKRPFFWIKTMCRSCMWPHIWDKGRPFQFRLMLLWNWLTGR